VETQQRSLKEREKAECATWQVLGGADLFLAGVIAPPEGLPHFTTGQLMAVRVLRHPLPFAVGVMECSSAEAAKSGMKGRGVKLNTAERVYCVLSLLPQMPSAPGKALACQSALLMLTLLSAGLKLLHTYTDQLMRHRLCPAPQLHTRAHLPACRFLGDQGC
jgi:hypothetical protein